MKENLETQKTVCVCANCHAKWDFYSSPGICSCCKLSSYPVSVSVDEVRKGD